MIPFVAFDLENPGTLRGIARRLRMTAVGERGREFSRMGAPQEAGQR